MLRWTDEGPLIEVQQEAERARVVTLVKDTFVLFVDMMGFANLVEAEGDELAELGPVLDGVEKYASPVENLLQYRFVYFHKCIESARQLLWERRLGTAIVFSDSAFFQVKTLKEAVELSRELMHNLVDNNVPARMGLAQGSFCFLRSVTDTSSEVSYHMSQFLGTGVVRAYATERCGIPGLRAFLHPGVTVRGEGEDVPVLPVPEQCEKLAVVYEVNYLEKEPHTLMGKDFSDVLVFDGLGWMHSNSEEKYHHHYEATLAALNRMRAQYGREAYPVARYIDRDKYDREHGLR